MHRIRRVCGILLTLASVLLVVWSVVHVTARTLRGDGEGRDIALKMFVWGSALEERIYREEIEKFEAANPRIRIKLIHVAHANFESKLKTMIAAGDPPDAFFLPYSMLPEYASMGLIEPMEDTLREHGADWGDDIYPVLIQAFRYDLETQTRGVGPLWGVPGDFTPMSMYINVDLFEQAGVPVPYDGWTWDEFEDAARKIDALGDDYFGAFLEFWPDALLAIVWNHGGEFFHLDVDGRADFTRPAKDNPGLVAAFERMRRLRLDEGIVYNAIGIGLSGSQEFYAGRVGAMGPTGRWVSSRCEEIEAFSYEVVPIPHRPGFPSRSPVMTIAWTVSSSSPNKTEAKRLAMHLVRPDAQRRRAELGMSVPSSRSVGRAEALKTADRKTVEMPMYLKLAEYADIQQWPRETEFQDILEAEQSASLRLGTRSIEESLASLERRWAERLASPLETGAYQRMPWGPVGGSMLAAVLCAGLLLAWMARREHLGVLDRAQERAGFAFISPWLLGFVALAAGPMFLSGVLALSNWSAITPLGEAEYVGAGNFVHMLYRDAAFWKSLVVTAYFVVLAIPIGQIAALAVALLMNVEVRGITVFRTIFFVPSVITGVVLGTLWLALFNNNYGLINRVLSVPLGWIGLSPPNWFGTDAQWAAIPAFVLMGLWGVGSAMVIYLAGLKSIPRSLTEAATIDGASAWSRLIHITLPMLSPLIFFNLVMGIIGSFQVFTQAFVMTGRGPDDATLFYVLYLYIQAFEFHNMGYASALAWVLFALILVVTLIAFRGSRNLVHYEGLK